MAQQEATPKIASFTNQELTSQTDILSSFLYSLSHLRLAMFAWAAARLGRFTGRALRLVAKETKARLQDLTAQDITKV